MVKLLVELPQEPALSSHPHEHMNNIKIKPSSRAIDSGKWLCAHLIIFENVSCYEERMYFLRDTHHGTVSSTFPLISRPKMKVKTCQFGVISGLATRSTSCRRFLEIDIGCGIFLIIKQNHNNHGIYTVVSITSGCTYWEYQQTEHE